MFSEQGAETVSFSNDVLLPKGAPPVFGSAGVTTKPLLLPSLFFVSLSPFPRDLALLLCNQLCALHLLARLQPRYQEKTKQASFEFRTSWCRLPSTAAAAATATATTRNPVRCSMGEKKKEKGQHHAIQEQDDVCHQISLSLSLSHTHALSP
jgi:hypothetical protein